MIARYLVYRDGAYRAWTRSSRMRVSAPDAAEHDYAVVAVDDQGHRSGPTPPVRSAALNGSR